MHFQSNEQKYHLLARLSLTSLYILLSIDFVIVLAGYFLSRSNSPYTGSALVRDIIFAVAIFDLLAIYLVKKFMLANALKAYGPEGNRDFNQFQKMLFSITMNITLMCSAISVYGLILVILGEKFEIMLLFVVASLIGYQLFRLRAKDFGDDSDGP